MPYYDAKLDALYSSNEDLYKDIDIVLIENQIGKIAVRINQLRDAHPVLCR